MPSWHHHIFPGSRKSDASLHKKPNQDLIASTNDLEHGQRTADPLLWEKTKISGLYVNCASNYSRAHRWLNWKVQPIPAIFFNYRSFRYDVHNCWHSAWFYIVPAGYICWWRPRTATILCILTVWGLFFTLEGCGSRFSKVRTHYVYKFVARLHLTSTSKAMYEGVELRLPSQEAIDEVIDHTNFKLGEKYLFTFRSLCPTKSPSPENSSTRLKSWYEKGFKGKIWYLCAIFGQEGHKFNFCGLKQVFQEELDDIPARKRGFISTSDEYGAGLID